jgi:hypothetical protein
MDRSPTPSSSPAVEEPDEVSSDDEEILRKARQRSQRVVAEMLSTEESYVESLRILLKYYLEPLQKLLDREDHSRLFSNILTIYGFNCEFVDQLKKKAQSWTSETSTQTMGKLYITYGHFFKMYTVYVNNFDSASTLFASLIQDNRRFREYCEKQLKDPATKNLSLTSYLIMPIQRIPRYKMLVSQLKQELNSDHPDLANLENALELIGSVALHINESVRQHENFIEMQAIQHQLQGQMTVVAPGRMFIKKGTQPPLLSIHRKFAFCKSLNLRCRLLPRYVDPPHRCRQAKRVRALAVQRPADLCECDVVRQPKAGGPARSGRLLCAKRRPRQGAFPTVARLTHNHCDSGRCVQR